MIVLLNIMFLIQHLKICFNHSHLGVSQISNPRMNICSALAPPWCCAVKMPGTLFNRSWALLRGRRSISSAGITDNDDAEVALALRITEALIKLNGSFYRLKKIYHCCPA